MITYRSNKGVFTWK